MYIVKANTRNMSKFLILHNRVKVHELFTLHNYCKNRVTFIMLICCWHYFANSLIKNKTKTPLLLFVLYPKDITARNGPMFYAKTAAKE